MKIDDLKNSFDAISPTPEQKDKMLTEILNAEDTVKGFNFTRLFATAIGLAAVIAISVIAFNYGDFNVTESENMVAYKTEEPAQKKTIKEENIIKKSVKTEKKEKAIAPVKEDKTETIVAEAPAPMSMARTIENPENVETEDVNENSGIAVASEENEHNQGIAVVSEENTTDNVEWLTVPALEEAEDLEEENVRTEEDEETEKAEETEEEENEEETTEVTE